MMKEVKYRLCPSSHRYAAGTTDLKQAIGKPVDLNGCTVFLCTEGTAVITLNFKRRKLHKGDFAILSNEMSLIPLRISGTFAVRFVSFPPETAEDVYYKISSTSFWETLDAYPVLHPLAGQYQLLDQWFIQTEWVIETAHEEYKERMSHNSLYNLCVAIDSEIRRLGFGNTDSWKKNRGWDLLNHFFTLLYRHYPKCREVDFYAKKLCITPDYLYKLTYKAVKTSPKEIIDHQVLVAIKTFLLNTNLSVKDIASELSFDDPSYMCRFFRRMTGMSPIEFRNNSKITGLDRTGKNENR